MTVKELSAIVSPYQDMQIFDSKTMTPYTSVQYRADSGCEVFDSYGEDEVYSIVPMVNSEGKPYLAVLVEMEI